MKDFQEQLQQIKAFIFDFDGVMTDGSVWTYGDRETVRAGNIKDGYALQYAVKKGYIVAVISGATSLSILNRMESLGVKHVFMGCANKMETYERFLQEQNLQDKNVLYMGDDIPDYEVLKRCGIGTCPADAATEIKGIAKYISPIPGGKGCVRDVIEQTLKQQGNWFHPDAVNW